MVSKRTSVAQSHHWSYVKEASASSSSAIDLSAGIHLLLEMKPGAQAGAAESLSWLTRCLLTYTACPTSCAWLQRPSSWQPAVSSPEEVGEKFGIFLSLWGARPPHSLYCNVQNAETDAPCEDNAMQCWGWGGHLESGQVLLGDVKCPGDSQHWAQLPPGEFLNTATTSKHFQTQSDVKIFSSYHVKWWCGHRTV